MSRVKLICIYCKSVKVVIILAQYCVIRCNKVIFKTHKELEWFLLKYFGFFIANLEHVYNEVAVSTSDTDQVKAVLNEKQSLFDECFSNK